MNPKSVNANNCEANGYFLTYRADNEIEQAVWTFTVEKISEQLRDRKVRASNVLDNLETIHTLVHDVVELVKEEDQKQHKDMDGAFNDKQVESYVWMATVACLSWYNKTIKNMKNKKNN